MTEVVDYANSVAVYAPDAHNPPIPLDLDKFMGTWFVTYSTLPLWKSRKDVTISYTPKESSGGLTQFDDLVKYRSNSDSPSSKLNSVIGVDTLVVPPSTAGATADIPKTRFKWRGKGWLMIASSRWQILGCSSASETSQWAITYFEKTLFTPAGLDIYARTSEGLPDALLQEIIAKTKALGGEVSKLAEQFFEVERSQPPMTDS